GKDSFLNLTIRHQINRFEIVVPIERADDFRQVFARKWLAARQNQNSEIAAERLRDAINLVRLHLELLAGPIVQFVSEETVRAAHVAHGSHQNVQKDWREGLAQGHLRITLQ